VKGNVRERKEALWGLGGPEERKEVRN